MLRLFLCALGLLCSSFSYASQKETINWYMTQSEFAPLFTEEYFDREHFIFKRELLTDTSEGNKQRLQQLSRLFLSLLSSPDVNLVGSTLARDVLKLELRAIDKIYSDTKRKELLKEMECAAASIKDDFFCGFAFWEKMSTSTFFSLTVNTVLMPTLVAIDLKTGGAANSIRRSAKLGRKKGHKILSVFVKGDVFAGKLLKSSKNSKKLVERLKKVKLTERTPELLAIVNSMAFKLMLDIVGIAANLKDEYLGSESEFEYAAKIGEKLSDLNIALEEFRSKCGTEVSQDACVFFDSLNKDEISGASKALINVGFKSEAKLAITAIDNKLAQVTYALVEGLVINPITDGDSSELIPVLLETGAGVSELAPYIGPIISWINSVRKAKEEMYENFQGARYEFELFTIHESELTSVVLARYQAAIIEDTIFAVINSPGDIPFQVLNRENLKEREFTQETVADVFNQNIGEFEYRRLITLILEKQNTCVEQANQSEVYILHNEKYDVQLISDEKDNLNKNNCSLITFTHTVNSNVSIVYNYSSYKLYQVLDGGFADIYPSSEYAIAVGSLVTKGILDNKNTNFYPKKYITRAEFYAIVQRAFFLQSSYNVTEGWSLNSLNILKQSLPNISINETLDEPITVSEVGKLLAGSTNIKSNLGFLAERHYGQACSALEPSLFKLLANDYLLVQKNNDIACPYRIYNGSKLTRGDAAILIANALEGVE